MTGFRFHPSTRQYLVSRGLTVEQIDAAEMWERNARTLNRRPPSMKSAVRKALRQLAKR